jgi:flagella basal body P-ring formation protein FlgA
MIKMISPQRHREHREERSRGRISFLCVLCVSVVNLFFAPLLKAQVNESASWPLASQAQVDSQGIFLKNILAPNFNQPLPSVRLADAPNWGRVTFLTRAQITELLAKAAPDLNPVWSGPERVRVIRRNRMLDETEVKQMLTSVLQSEHVRERGELELRFVRPFLPVQAPDEALSLKVIDLPNSGVTPQFIARCELRAGDELIANFQINVNAKIWRDIWVARSQLLRGQPMTSADIGLERRDVLNFKDGLVTLPTELSSYDIGENVPAGAILTARTFKQRPIIRRGKTIDALIQDGALQIAVKVEALEDGLPGQIVRVRNIKSRREFRGKVQDEETVAVAL